MRKAEWISLAAFSFFIIASWLRPVTSHRRMVIAAVGAVGTLLITATHLLPQLSGSVARDWLPSVLMPMVYWQAGWFSSKLNDGFQKTLQGLDRRLLGTWISNLRKPRYRWIVACLELAYLSCYVLVPMGLAFLYVAGLERHAKDYWSVVLLATYPCYAFTAFVPTEPPRTSEIKPNTTPAGKIRRFNMWIVRWFSIQLNTFPSAHVTATLGSSLVLLHFLPKTGLVFVLISIGIGLGAVLGRYHYAADVLVGGLLTVVVYTLVLTLY